MNALSSLTTSNLLLGQARLGPQSNSALPSRANGMIQPKSSQADFEAMFSVNQIDENKLKVNLTERLAKTFDLDTDDFADAGAMARKVKEIVAKMQPATISSIEKSLGLDKLGIRLGELLDALIDPSGSSNKKLMGALRAEAGKLSADQNEASKALKKLGLDEIGRYGQAG